MPTFEGGLHEAATFARGRAVHGDDRDAVRDRRTGGGADRTHLDGDGTAGRRADVDVEWHTIQHPDGTSQLVAVARPPKGKGKGPFPAVIELHGGSGLGPAMVEHAASLAKAGFVVVLGCYGPDQGWSGPPWCATTPFVPNALEALDEFTSELPGVRKQHIGVLGLSSGAGPTFNYPWGPSVRARGRLRDRQRADRRVRHRRGRTRVAAVWQL